MTAQLASNTLHLPLVLHLYETDAVDAIAGLDEADLGVDHVGPAGLAQHLLTSLGLPGPTVGWGARVATMERRLAELDDGGQWFSGSRSVDPWGVAEWVQWAVDNLRLAGWDGRAMSATPRLASLSAAINVSHDPPPIPGLPDLWHALLAELDQTDLSIRLEVHLECLMEVLPPIVRMVLGRLAELGHSVMSEPEPGALAAPDTDLGRVQRALLDQRDPDRLIGDGSFIWVEADSPIQAATLAVRLSPGGEHDCHVVTAEGSLLEVARAQVGLPALGLRTASIARPVLQVLPLILDLAFAPQDPSVALELLSLPVNPIPGKVRHALRRSLASRPAVNGPAWNAALATALEAWRTAMGEETTDPESREATVRARLAAYFPQDPASSTEGATAARLASLCEDVAAWARGRGQVEDSPDKSLIGAAAIASDLARMLRTLPADHLIPRIVARQMHDLAVGSGLPFALPVEVGAPSAVTDPSAVPWAVDSLTWFGMVAGAAERAPGFPWTEVERTELAAVGCMLAAPGELRRLEQRAWLRALLSPRKRVLLVSWRGTGVEATETHPLVDVLRAHLGPESLRNCMTSAQALLEDSDGLVPSVDISPAAPIVPRPIWRIEPGSLPSPTKVSATSIEMLLDCPLRWVLSYGARLFPGGVDTLPDLASFTGSFGHTLLQELVTAKEPPFATLTPEDAQRRCLEAFDARVADEAAPLLLPGRKSARESIRRDIGRAAKDLVRLLQKSGWTPTDAEQEVSGNFAGIPFQGWYDLLLQRNGALALLDLKKGGRPGKVDALRKGRALQLALYARGLNVNIDTIPTAYFIIEEGRLLTKDTKAFPGEWSINGPSHSATLKNAEETWAWWWAALQGGAVVRRDDPDNMGSELVEEVGCPPPPSSWHEQEAHCGYCNQARICQFSTCSATAEEEGA